MQEVMNFFISNDKITMYVVFLNAVETRYHSICSLYYAFFSHTLPFEFQMQLKNDDRVQKSCLEPEKNMSPKLFFYGGCFPSSSQLFNTCRRVI